MRKQSKDNIIPLLKEDEEYRYVYLNCIGMTFEIEPIEDEKVNFICVDCGGYAVGTIKFEKGGKCKIE